MPVLPRLNNYDDIYRQFRWQVPARYNIGVDVCDRWAAQEPDRLAILHVHPDGREDAISYGALRETSNRLANVLRAHGVKRGDRVGILLPQAPEVAAAHIAIYKLGAIALPLAMLFGVEAISYRLKDSGARALITGTQGLEKLAQTGDAAHVAWLDARAASHRRAADDRAVRRSEVLDDQDVALLVDAGVPGGGKWILEADLGAVAAAEDDLAVEVIDHPGVVTGSALHDQAGGPAREIHAPERRSRVQQSENAGAGAGQN